MSLVWSTAVFILNAAVAVGTLLAALFWMRSARVKVGNNQDKFIEDLQRIGDLNSHAAIAASVAAIAAFILWLMTVL
jgi:hypothetical protein